MKVSLQLPHYILIVGVIGLFSCEKEFNTISSHNIPPVANAGADQIAILPKDSVILDATSSKDPDGNITTYHWTKIDGPALFTIVNDAASTTMVRSLVQGVYKFEMKVTDNKGSIGKDTVQVTVIAGNGINQPPVADAGTDQTITLPTNLCTLNGKDSYDPDGNINAYQWTKIAGPSSFTIQDQTGVETIVNNLVEGVYLFELIVTDNVGLNDKDTVQINVVGICDISGRPQINAALTQIGTLSEARAPYVAAAGSKIVFAGGINQTGSGYIVSSAVDIYDVNTHSWSTAQLSRAREGIATISCGNKIFFAGGGYFDLAWDNVDIYDVSTGEWTVAQLSEPRAYLTAAAVGNKVLFAGGFTNESNNATNTVDIYDLSSGTWSIASLSQPRFNLSAVTVGNKIYFAGGNGNNDEKNMIDIYNDLNAANPWSTSSLMELSGPVSGVVVGDNIYWGGIAQQQNMGKVEQWNTNNNSVAIYCLSYPRFLPTAVVKNDNIVFFTSGIANTYGPITNTFDIYNIQSNKWAIGILNNAIRGAGIISLNNTIYMGGGELTFNSCTNKVYTLSW